MATAFVRAANADANTTDSMVNAWNILDHDTPQPRHNPHNEIHIVVESMLEDMDDFTCTPPYKKKTNSLRKPGRHEDIVYRMGSLSTVLHVLQLKIQAKSGKESHCQVPEQSTTS
jgi:hypothetical protein